jgi:hypothetical protein
MNAVAHRCILVSSRRAIRRGYTPTSTVSGSLSLLLAQKYIALSSDSDRPRKASASRTSDSRTAAWFSGPPAANL